MIKKALILLFGLILSGCSYFTIHKMEVEQGNIVNETRLTQVHRGMSPETVQSILGTPVLENLIKDNQLIYVYTFQVGGDKRSEKKVIIRFNGGQVSQIMVH